MLFNTAHNTKDNIIIDGTARAIKNDYISIIGSYAFASCDTLISIDFPVCINISDSAFYYCTNLTTAFFQNCDIIGSCTFYNASLSNISFPMCTTINASAFFNNPLLSADFPLCDYVGISVFRNCHNLSTVNLPTCGSTIYTGAFYSCYNLISLYLDQVSAVPEITSTTFYSTPIGGYSTSAGRYGSVFVPASLYNDFIVASYWSDISDRIVSVDTSSSSSSGINSSLVAKYIKRWYDDGTSTAATIASHYYYLPNTPSSNGNYVTHLTYQIITNDAFSVGFIGETSPMGEGPHVYISSAIPTDVDYLGSCIYMHEDDGMDFTTITNGVFSVSAGNNGKYLTMHTWCDDYANEFYTIMDLSSAYSVYNNEYYLIKK